MAQELYTIDWYEYGSYIVPKKETVYTAGYGTTISTKCCEAERIKTVGGLRQNPDL